MNQALCIFLGLFAMGCISSSEPSGGDTPTRGNAGGACYGNNTCNAGLVCVAKLCVDDAKAGESDGTSVEDSSSPGLDTGPSTPAAITFEGDIIPIFNNSCGGKDNACHAAVAYQADIKNGCRGWLALENAALGSVVPAGPDKGKMTGCPDMPLYDRLTKLDAWECGEPSFASFPKKKYVEPGDPARSHLLNKMNGGAQCGIPNPMPKGTAANPSDIDKITKWIKAGAPR